MSRFPPESQPLKVAVAAEPARAPASCVRNPAHRRTQRHRDTEKRIAECRMPNVDYGLCGGAKRPMAGDQRLMAFFLRLFQKVRELRNFLRCPAQSAAGVLANFRHHFVVEVADELFGLPLQPAPSFFQLASGVLESRSRRTVFVGLSHCSLPRSQRCARPIHYRPDWVAESIARTFCVNEEGCGKSTFIPQPTAQFRCGFQLKRPSPPILLVFKQLAAQLRTPFNAHALH